MPLRPEEEALTRRIQLSYSTAITRHRKLRWIEGISWFTWIIALITFAIWFLTAYQVALAAGAHTLHDFLANAFSNSQDGNVLIAYGAKYNQANSQMGSTGAS